MDEISAVSKRRSDSETVKAHTEGRSTVSINHFSPIA
jgi:hypothetical protein